MSDLSAAAEALGLPEALVERSAEARATETGASVDEILAEWAGGEVASSPAPTEEPAAEPEEAAPEEESPAEEAAEEAPPTPVIETPGEPEEPATPPVAAPSGPYKPPVLVGAKDNPMTVLAGIVGLFLIVVMVGLVGPSIAFDSPGARTSAMDYSDQALDGQEVYLQTGCAACHTQMVRPVVADVGLGPVTLNDTNQVIGTRRFGPDLSDVGTRITASQLEAIVGGLGDHPSQNLAQEDLSALVAYLSESATSVSGGGEES